MILLPKNRGLHEKVRFTNFKNIISFFVFISFLTISENIKATENFINENISTIPGKSINSLYKLKNGKVLAGTNSGLYNVYKNHAEKAYVGYEYSNIISAENIFDICELNEFIYIATGSGLFSIDQNTHQIEKIDLSSEDFNTKNPQINCLYISSRNRLWVGTNGTGAFTFIDKQIINYRTKVSDGKSIANDTIYKITEDKNGLIWIATAGNYINRFNINLITFERFSLNDKSNTIPISDIHFDNETLIISTLGDGVYTYDINSFSTYRCEIDSLCGHREKYINSIGFYKNKLFFSSKISGLYSELNNYNDTNGALKKHSSQMISTLMEDELVLWYGTSDGLIGSIAQKETIATIAPLSDDNGNPSWITSFTHDMANHTYVGTYAGRLLTLDHTSIYAYHNICPDPNFISPDFTIKTLLNDHTNNLWIGTQNAGLIQYDPIGEKVTERIYSKHTDSIGLSSNTVNSIISDESNNLWIGTNKGVDYYNINLKSFESVTILENGIVIHKDFQVFCFFTDEKSQIWMGTSIGLARKDFKTNSFHIYNNTITSSRSIHSIAQVNNKLWMGTNKEIISLNSASNNAKIELSLDIPNPINFIIVDNVKDIWFGSETSLIQYKTGEQLFIERSEVLNSDKNQIISSGYIDEFGYIYLGLNKGLAYFDPENISDEEYTNRIKPYKLIINNKEVLVGEKHYGKKIIKQDISLISRIVFPRQARDIEIHFSNPEEYTQNIDYDYKLVNYSKDWNRINNSVIKYTNLPYGTYQLQVCNGIFLDKSANIYELKLKIRRPIWRTWYFIFTVLGIGISLLLRFIRKNKEQMRGKLKELENNLHDKEKDLDFKEKVLTSEKLVLDQRAHEEKVLRYHSNGLAEFSESLSQFHNDVDLLMRKFIVQLVEFVNAHQGVVYKYNKIDPENDYLEICGVFTESQSIKERFEIGEGYIGSSFKKGEVIIVDNIPDSYSYISSGLGEDKPNHLIIVPIIHNEMKLGVVEISTFERLEEYKIDFIKSVSDNIASGMAIAISNTSIQQMLTISQEQGERLKASEEEMRQNMEEMKATQEDLHRQMEENKKMQSELASKSALLDTLMENIPDYVYFKDWDCKFIRISSSMLKLFPVDKLEDMVGKSDYDFQPKKVARKYEKDEKEIMKSGAALINDLQHEVMSNGVEQWVLTSKIPMYDKEGVCIGLFGITKDVTDLKQIEIEAKQKAAALEESEEELRQNLEEMRTIQEQMVEGNALLNALMLNLPDYIYFKDKESKFIRISNSMLKLFPVDTLEEMVGKSDFDFQPHESAKKYFDEEMKIIESGKGVLNTVQHEVMKNGVEQWVSTSKLPLINEHGECIGTFGVTTDITDIKKMEIEATAKAAALEESQEELRQNMEEMRTIQEQVVEGNALLNALMHNLPDYIYFKDKESKFIRISNSMLKLFPVDTIEEMVGKSDFDFQPHESAKKYYDDEMRIIKTGEGVMNDVQHEVMSNGVEQWVSTSKLPLIDEHGECIGTFGVTTNITDIKKMEIDATEKAAALEESQEELRQNMEEMRTIQDQMVEGNALLNSLMLNLPDYIYFKDKESKFLRISNSMLKLFPVETLEEMVGKSDFDFQPQEVAQQYYDGEMKIIETGEGVINEINHEVMSNGVEQWVATTKLPLVNEMGQIIGTFGISKDITDIKKMEIEAQQQAEEILAQEEELRQNLEEMHTIQEDLQRNKNELLQEKALIDSLMNTIPERIYFKDKKSKFLRVSNSMLKLFKVDKYEDLIGKSTFDMLPKEYADKLWADEQRIMNSGEGLFNDIVEEKKDGKSIWVSTTKLPLYDENGECIGIWGITKDITEIKTLEIEAKQQMEEILSQEEELRQNLEEMQTIQEDLERNKVELSKGNALLNALMNNLPDYIYFKDEESRFIRISKSMLKLFPVKKLDDMVGKSDFDFQPPDAAQKYYDDEKKIQKSGKGVINDIQHEIMSNGVEQWVSTTKLPLYNEAGECIGTFGISKDVTELKSLEIVAKNQEQELRKYIKQLETEIKKLKK